MFLTIMLVWLAVALVRFALATLVLAVVVAIALKVDRRLGACLAADGRTSGIAEPGDDLPIGGDAAFGRAAAAKSVEGWDWDDAAAARYRDALGRALADRDRAIVAAEVANDRGMLEAAEAAFDAAWREYHVACDAAAGLAVAGH